MHSRAKVTHGLSEAQHFGIQALVFDRRSTNCRIINSRTINCRITSSRFIIYRPTSCQPCKRRSINCRITSSVLSFVVPPTVVLSSVAPSTVLPSIVVSPIVAPPAVVLQIPVLRRRRASSTKSIGIIAQQQFGTTP